MGSTIEPYTLTATEVISQVKNGSLTVEEYAKSLLRRIEQRDPVVKAWAYLDRELVLEQARELDQIPPEQRGPLHGVAVGVKDVIYTKGDIPVPTNIQSRLTDTSQTCQPNITRPSTPPTHRSSTQGAFPSSAQPAP